MGVACGDNDSLQAPKLDVPNATGQQLAGQFLTLLQEQDTDGLRAYLSDAFIIQRADGSSSTKDEYLTKLPEVRDYEIRNVTAKQSGGAFTVKWDLVVDAVINGKAFAGDPAPRLSTFAWDASAGRWRMTSHANFNAPATPAATGGR